jgi:hypothetical protein
MKENTKLSIPESLAELLKLQRKYKSVDEALIPDKDKMTALALSIGGFEALADIEAGYLKYLEELSQKRYELYISGSESEINKLEGKLAWFANMLHSNYSESFSKAKRTQQKFATIYVEVEKYCRKKPDSKLQHATDAVATDLGLDPKYVHTRYYAFKKQSSNMPIEEVIREFQLPITL